MSEAQDQTRREAEDRSRRCPYCHGAGMVFVFHADYDGGRTVMRRVVDRGEVIERAIPAIVAAHCVCPVGEWIRSKTDRELLSRIPNFADVLAGRSRWLAADPTRDADGVPNWDFRRARRELGEKIEAR